MTWPIRHLTSDDLDAFHSESLSPDAKTHLQECVECRTLIDQDRSLVAALDALPAFAPSAHFAEQVLARVGNRAVAPARNRTRLALAASVLIALGTSVWWSLANRPLLLSWLNDVGAGISRGIWMGAAAVAQAVSDQPWVSGASAGTLALAGGVLLLSYSVAMIALRRILAFPSRPAADANW